MNTEQQILERFKVFAEKMRAEGKTDQEIERAFRNFLHLDKSNRKDKARRELP